MIVTVQADAVPPRIKVETTATTVYRVQGSTRTQVRGTVDAGIIYDYEAPQQVPVAYDDGLTVSALVELPNVGDWLIHLADSTLSCPIVFGRLPSEEAPDNLAVTDVPGRGAVAVTFERGSERGSFVLNTYTLDEKAALKALLVGGSVLFLSTHDEVDFGPAYVALGAAPWSRRMLGIADQGRLVSLSYVEVDRPVLVESTTGGAIEDLVGTIGALLGTIGDLGV